MSALSSIATDFIASPRMQRCVKICREHARRAASLSSPIATILMWVNGPRAKSLKIPPADLTKVAKSNNGDFPSEVIADIIDGRATVAAHGARDMPVWGDRYRTKAYTTETPAEIDQRARAQIAALVRYLKTIQEK